MTKEKLDHVIIDDGKEDGYKDFHSVFVPFGKDNDNAYNFCLKNGHVLRTYLRVGRDFLVSKDFEVGNILQHPK